MSSGNWINYKSRRYGSLVGPIKHADWGDPIEEQFIEETPEESLFEAAAEEAVPVAVPLPQVLPEIITELRSCVSLTKV